MGNASSSSAKLSPTDKVLSQQQQQQQQQCCFFFPNPLARGPGNGGGALTDANDDSILGSPMPDTPVQVRQHRQRMLQQEGSGLRNGSDATGGEGESARGSAIGNNQRTSSIDGVVYSSKYSGLEKELDTASSTASGAQQQQRNGQNGNGNNADDDDGMAQIHDGTDAEAAFQHKYALEEMLGVGSTSTVHKCTLRHPQQQQQQQRDQYSSSYYACKIIDCESIESKFNGMMGQFQTEILTLRQLRHPNIIQLYDVYLCDQAKIYIVMEHCRGGELFDYVVAKGTLSEQEASRIVYQVTSAVVYMHSKNIVHRDMKPENLLLKDKPSGSSKTGGGSGSEEDVTVKIIDFGLSKLMEEPVARTFLGTRGYLAPEMLQRRDYTRAVDTWALGVIVFVLLCGCLPFDDDSSHISPSDQDLLQQKFHLRFPRWAKNLSKSAKDLLSHLLDVNPMTRYTAEEAIEHPWVRGVTANEKSLLQSPGRIKNSPMLRGSLNQRRGGGAKNRKSPRTGNTTTTTTAARKAAQRALNIGGAGASRGQGALHAHVMGRFVAPAASPSNDSSANGETPPTPSYYGGRKKASGMMVRKTSI